MCLDPHSAVGVVGEVHAELRVERRLVLDVSIGQYADDVPQRLDERADLRLGQLAAGNFPAQVPVFGEWRCGFG